MSVRQPDRYELLAAAHMAAALQLTIAAGRHRIAASMALADRSLCAFADAWNASVAREVAGHPDLAELDVQLNARYEPPPV